MRRNILHRASAEVGPGRTWPPALALVASLALAFVVAGCDDDDPVGLDTGLTGTVVRGPTQPVCQVDDPCEDEPFAALFHVTQAGRTVGQFRSAEDGTFSIPLTPGTYVVIPDESAPILFPAQQSQQVDVGSTGFTEVVLIFDTGIR